MKTTVLVHYWQKKSFLLVLKLELSFIFPFPDLFFGIHPPTLRYAKKKKSIKDFSLRALTVVKKAAVL